MITPRDCVRLLRGGRQIDLVPLLPDEDHGNDGNFAYRARPVANCVRSPAHRHCNRSDAAPGGIGARL